MISRVSSTLIQSQSIETEPAARKSIEELESLLKTNEREPNAYIDLARHCIQVRQLGSAICILRHGLDICEPDEKLYIQAIYAHQEANRLDEAIQLAQRARELFPTARYFEIREALMLPVLYANEEDIEHYRARFSAGLRKLIAELKLDTAEDSRLALEGVGQYVNFYPGYQGRNDRELQELYGQLVHNIVARNYPEWVKPLRMPSIAPGGKIRVGYISAHFRNHSVSKLFLGWLRERNRQDFEVFTYHNGQTLDSTTEDVQRMSDHFRHLPEMFEPLCRAVLSDNLHVAVYLDVRHRRMAMMSSLRLAPVQCVAWAHPITTGSPVIDYYLSSELMEPPTGQDHYSERLIPLPGIGVCYPKPVIPRPLLTRTRKDFGLDEDGIIFLCCQTTFKYLPQHDDLFARIAKRVPASQFVFLALNDMVAKDFQARLQRAFNPEGLDASNHCVILPQLSTLAYWNLNLISDVFLDSLEWSGGVTTLEAIACGLPVVTLPGDFMRGRHSYGILMQLGLTETIARDKDDYVEIASRLGMDKQWRSQIIERMAAAHGRLYSDKKCVSVLEQFFRSVVTDRSG